jgi:hypothetical protein
MLFLEKAEKRGRAADVSGSDQLFNQLASLSK